jgi:hypothetical protein
MRHFTPVNKLAVWLSWSVAAILVLLPFHAFLTVWLSSLVGHYTLLRLWKEFLLVLIILGSLYLLLRDRVMRRCFWRLWPVRLILVYGLLLVICAAAARVNDAVSAKAMWYGLLVDLRFLAFFLAVLVIASSSDWLAVRWRKILFGPAVLVAAFAILQYLVLPTDFLRHFGYGDSTISPYETINKNVHNLRVASTLRGANNLGAYLVMPICALAVGFLRSKRQRLDAAVVGFGLLMALAFSFSRSAWLGALLGVLSAGWVGIRSQKLKRKAGLAMAGLAVLCGLITFSLHNNQTFQNILLHNDRTPTKVTSSNEGHAAALKAASKDVIHQPLGAGVGTAGPQSVYNTKPARISENYFLQIGQEAGILGMLLFIAICASAGWMLYGRRAEPLALALFVSLIGLTLVNLLSHAWTDDTVSYIWWGFSGIALSPAIIEDRLKPKNGKKIKTA